MKIGDVIDYGGQSGGYVCFEAGESCRFWPRIKTQGGYLTTYKSAITLPKDFNFKQFTP